MKKIILLLLFPLAAWAQQPATLGECLRLGLERNYDIRIVRNRERVAQNNATLGNAGFLPTAELAAGFNGTADNDGSHSERSNAGVDVGWTLFDGFRVKTNYQRLKELERMGELETRLVTEEFVALFTAEYYNYICQRIRLDNLRYAVELSRERFEIVEVSEQIGAMSGYDLQQARVDLNADSSQLVKQYEVLHTLGTRLGEMLGGDDAGSAPLQPRESEIDYDDALAHDRLRDGALTGNTALLLALKEGDLSRLDLRGLQARNYPAVRLGGGYGYNGTPGRPYTLGANYGATVGFTLFDGMNRRREQRNARIEIENRELAYDKARLAVDVEFSNAWMAYRNNLALVEMEQQNLATARLGYRLAMERYRGGQLSGIELREAQTSLLEANERLVQVRYDVKLCEIGLLRIAGMIGRYLGM
jgi:outer membrane protein TolC